MSWSDIDSPINYDYSFQEALREKDFEIQRQRNLVIKLRKDRNLLNAELLEMKWKYEAQKVELKQCKQELKTTKDMLTEHRVAASSGSQDEKNEIDACKKSIKELLERNEKQGTIVKNLIKENRSLRKERGPRFPPLKVPTTRLTTQRMSIT